MTTTALEIYEASIENNIFNLNSPGAINSATRGFFDEPTLTVEDIKMMAEGAYDVVLSDEIANEIIECHKNFYQAVNQNGAFSHEYFINIKEPLSEIEL